MYLEFSKAFPIRGFEPRTEKYPILETFLFFLSYGDSAALELRKAAKTCLQGQGTLQFIPYFSANVYLIFPLNLTIFFRKMWKTGIITCDFLAKVEG